MALGDNIKKIRKLRRLSVEDFAAQIGVSRQSIYDWEDGGITPRKKQLDKILQVLEVKVTQLFDDDSAENLTRVNESESPAYQGKLVPFFDAITTGGMSIIGEQTAVKEPKRMVNPGTFFRNAEGALQITGHSMFPKYPSGCIVAYRVASLDLLLWGEDYVVELREDRRLILKRIEKSDVKGCIKLVSYNVNKDNKYVYDPIDYPRDQIGRVFMVLGKIEIEAMQS